jgi:methionine biosynthesis protein MetW
VLDLGCGEGDLLSYLKKNRNVSGVGIEYAESKVAKCIERGLSVLQGDINQEIQDYPDTFFDYVILSQTLQQVYDPPKLILELMRVGSKGIVSFPSFSHWQVRLKLLLSGRAPVTRQLPYSWYDTPNIRVMTLKDFRAFAREVGFKIFKETAVNISGQRQKGTIIHFLPDFRANYGIYLIGKGKT